ncbi:hypothetical protein DTO271G3_8571 [Paecilomyces variotii]|nr:hypothetical protein DTO271G3_8571 [Paecilomyces variotii]
MTNSHTSHSSSHHRRTPSSSNAQKASGLRPSRPGLSRNTPTAHYSISKLGAGSGPTTRSTKEEEEKPDMAASFLQYCATCERQITVPNNSILYCSESCRRKDSCKPLSASFAVSASMSPSTSPPSSPPMSPRSIVAPLTPTRLPASSFPTGRIPAELHDAKSDLDPTEWKPVIHRRHGSAASLASSEAWNFLSQFLGNDEATPAARRPGMSHRSSSSLSILTSGATGPPSLTHTPSTATSSYNSSSEYVSLMFDFSNRPLPPRHNPSFSGSSGATKGVGLVVPHMHAPSSVEVVTIASSDSGSLFPASGGTWRENEAKKPTHSVSSVTSTLCNIDATAK